MSNNVAGDGIAMAADGTPNQPTVPAYNVSLQRRRCAEGRTTAQSTTIGHRLAYIITGNDDFMAGFSSQGPTDVDFRVKPDVVAPGVNVLSSIPMSYCGGDPASRSSRARRWRRRTWPVRPRSCVSSIRTGPRPQVRSAIVNTADQGVLKTIRSPVHRQRM